MWVRLCARKDEYFCSLKNVKKNTYIFSENNFFSFNILYVIELNYLRTETHTRKINFFYMIMNVQDITDLSQ